MAEKQTPVIQLRCFCGRKYRVRNAKPGFRTECPECGSLLEVTEGDLNTAFTSDGAIELHEEQVEAKPAIPLDMSELRPAAKGARPGVTVGESFAHEEAQLHSALGGYLLKAALPGDATAGATLPETPRRTFVADLVASFYFAGLKGNAFNVIFSALGSSVIFLIAAFLWYMAGSFFLFIIPTLFFYVLGVMYVVHYYWLILKTTAGGDDELPWYATDWDFWDDSFKPLVWMLFISFACSLPGLWVLWYVPETNPQKLLLIWVGLGLGWLFWPVAVMSVALGHTILFIRPDWLARCIIGIGPVYLLAWLFVIITLVAWVFYWATPLPSVAGVHVAVRVFLAAAIRICSVAVNFYFGYVLFRMLGLLFRHFRARFPWKY